MSNNENDKLIARIRHLLDKAANVSGTPEADAFNEKAMELIAKYNIDESQVSGEGGRQTDPELDKLKATKFPTTGSHGYQRAMLVARIAQALHCVPFWNAGEGWVKVYGVNRHLMRVKLLRSYLEPQMLAGASRALPPAGMLIQQREVLAHRSSWMEGFADGIGLKLFEVEAAAIRQADRNAGDTRRAVAFKSDFERAKERMERDNPHRARATSDAGTRSGYGEGRSKASVADVGQTRMGAGTAQPAIS